MVTSLLHQYITIIITLSYHDIIITISIYNSYHINQIISKHISLCYIIYQYIIMFNIIIGDNDICTCNKYRLATPT